MEREGGSRGKEWRTERQSCLGLRLGEWPEAKGERGEIVRESGSWSERAREGEREGERESSRRKGKREREGG